MPDDLRENRSDHSLQTRNIVWLHGVVLALLMALITWLSSRFGYGSPMEHRPILTMIALWILGFLVYLSALRYALQAASANWLLTTIVGFALLLRIPLLFSTPILEIDYYRYLWDGHVVLTGTSPYHYSPLEVKLAESSEGTPADLRRLVALQQSSPAIHTILSRIHFAEYPTLYPPVSQAVFALTAITTPTGSNVSTHILLLRVWLMLFDMATLVILLALLNDRGLPLGWAVAYGWCPLVLKEFTNSAHLDAIAVALTLLAVWLAQRACFGVLNDPISKTNTKRNTLQAMFATFCLGLAIGAKLYPVVLTPWLLFSIGRHIGFRQAALNGLLIVCVIAGICWPLVISEENISQSNNATLALAEKAARKPADPSRGLQAFLSRWEINDLFFLVLIENVKPNQYAATDPQTGKLILPWFVFTSDNQRVALCDSIAQLSETRFSGGFAIPVQRVPAFFSRTVMSLFFGLIAFGLAIWAARSNCAETFLCTAFLTLAWFWLLLPTQNPWYWIWALPLLPFAKGRAWVILSGCVFLYYTRFWFETPTTELPPRLSQICQSIYPGEYFFHFVLVWLEFLPVYLWLGLTALSRLRRSAE